MHAKESEGNLGETLQKLLVATAAGKSDQAVKGLTCGLTREIVLAHGRGDITTKTAVAYATSGRALLDDGGYDVPQLTAVETLLLCQLDTTSKPFRDARERLSSLADDLQKRLEKANKEGVVRPGLVWNTAYVCAASARVADLRRDADDAFGYARVAISLVWVDYAPAYSAYVDILRGIFFQLGDAVTAAALPAVPRADLDDDLRRRHYLLAPSLLAA